VKEKLIADSTVSFAITDEITTEPTGSNILGFLWCYAPWGAIRIVDDDDLFW